jgi:putative nucleotidyltransferase with HDIG domain
VVGRFGGDEFIAILPGSDIEEAVSVVERLRSAVSGHRFQVDGGRELPLSMSYGIAAYPSDGRTASELLAAADANLYRSKQMGGSNITVTQADEAGTSSAMGSFTVLDGLVTAVDNKDHYTRQHSDDVTRHALALASKLGLSLETQRSLRVAAILHDVGKVGVPDQILRKPADLTEEEAEVVRQHVTLGELIINGIPNQEEVLSAVSCHHERFDGKGYPRGLKGMEIPLLGRILAVTDAYSAMTTDRPYRKALSDSEARAELRRIAGTQLDPRIVRAFIETLEESEISRELGASTIAIA